MADVPVFDISDLNRKAYETAQSRRVYRKASGWLDAGEQAAIAASGFGKPGCAVLDIGIGGGRTTPLLSAINPNYVGVDYISQLVEAARARFPEADLRQMDARRLAFGDGAFDAVLFSYNGIDSVNQADRIAILAEIFRVLRPGGCFCFSSLNRYGPAFAQQFQRPFGMDTSSLRALVLDLARAIRWYAMFLVVGLPVYLQARRANRRSKTTELVARQVSAHYGGLVLLFTSAAANVALLRQAGFEVALILDEAGNDVAGDGKAEDSRWLYYVARKPAAAGLQGGVGGAQAGG
ncbi:MAG TPA: class I SAM-dependent methyltransferase [Acetobacteraceae bacterium]|jgi:ubiquinone/menaquinone biosynthesis C-methylase UbiE